MFTLNTKVVTALVVLCSVLFVVQCSKKDKIIIGNFGSKKRHTQISE